MKRNNIILQILDKEIAIIKNHKLYTYKTNSVHNYEIINTQNFIKTINIVIKELHLNNNILTDNITILIDTSYTKDNKDKLIKIFKDLLFNKIEFIYINNILENKNELNIQINNEKIIFYYKEKTYITYYFNDKLIEILCILIKSFTSIYHIKIVKLFGEETKINQVIKQVNIHNVELYKYSYSSIFPIVLLK